MSEEKPSEIESLAAEIHGVYCRQYEKNHGKPYRTNGDYSQLDEPTKDYDRAFIRWHLARLEELEKENERLHLDPQERACYNETLAMAENDTLVARNRIKELEDSCVKLTNEIDELRSGKDA